MSVQGYVSDLLATFVRAVVANLNMNRLYTHRVWKRTFTLPSILRGLGTQSCLPIVSRNISKAWPIITVIHRLILGAVGRTDADHRPLQHLVDTVSIHRCFR